MKKYILIFLFIGSVVNITCGQTAANSIKTKKLHTIRQIHIGDRVPDMIIPDMINYPTSTLNLSGLKGKFVILDFWTTGCIGCIESFPKMKELQDKFPKQLKVILVDFESKKLIQKFLALHKRFTGVDVKMPVATNNKLLMEYFQPSGYPHYVWIDQKGIVRYITYADVVNEENIKDALKNKPLQLAEKKDEQFNWDIERPLYVNGNGGDGKSIICYSVLAHSPKGFATCGGYYNPGEKTSSIYAYGSPIKGLFQFAFNDYLNGYDIPMNRTVLQVKDTSKYVWYLNGVTQWQNCYNYQLIAPYRSAESLKKMEREDLMRYFDLEAHMEKRMMKCWVMTAEDTSLLKTKGGFHETGISVKDFTLTIRNEPDSVIGHLFKYIIFYDSPHPFVNDIHMKSHADVFLENINYESQEAVIRALYDKYKINIRLEDHLVDILVISEPEYDRDKAN